MAGVRGRRRICIGAAVAAAAVACGAAAACVRLIRRADLHVRLATLFGPACVFTVEDGVGNPVRMLSVGRSVQSGTYLGERRFELPFEYYRAFERAVCTQDAVHDVLMLGGGACAYPRHALIAHADLRMDVVELDPSIIDLARRYFYLDELEERAGERLSLVAGDALAYLATTNKAYDVIINDLFAQSEAVAAFAEDEGMELVKAHLRENGIYLVNAVASPPDYRRLAELGAALERQFARVEMVECTDEDFSTDENYLFICRGVNR